MEKLFMIVLIMMLACASYVLGVMNREAEKPMVPVLYNWAVEAQQEDMRKNKESL